MAVTKRLRFEILKRDDYTCRYCGGKAPDVALRVDHVTPVALGGTDLPTNLVAACHDCNSGKSSIDPDAPTVENVANDALRWASAIQYVMDDMRKQRIALDSQITWFDLRWCRWGRGEGKDFTNVPRPTDWPDSIERFLTLGVPTELLDHFIGVTMRKEGVVRTERWTYFCGCCWRSLEDAQAKAKQDIAFNDEWLRKAGVIQ